MRSFSDWKQLFQLNKVPEGDVSIDENGDVRIQKSMKIHLVGKIPLFNPAHRPRCFSSENKLYIPMEIFLWTRTATYPNSILRGVQNTDLATAYYRYDASHESYSLNMKVAQGNRWMDVGHQPNSTIRVR